MLGDATSRRAGNEYLMRVIEARFPHARQSRLRIEARNLEVYRCIARFGMAFNQASGNPAPEDRDRINACFRDPATQPPEPPAANDETAVAPPTFVLRWPFAAKPAKPS
jgi:hypothetical protein